MEHYLEAFKALLGSGKHDKLRDLELEVNAAIEANARITDYLKKQHHAWNNKTNELCLLKDMIKKELEDGGHVEN